MGIPLSGSRYEFDCHLCHVLDHGRLFRPSHGSSLRQVIGGFWRRDFSARRSGLGSDAGFLVHPVLDVSAENFFEDLRRLRKETVRVSERAVTNNSLTLADHFGSGGGGSLVSSF